MLQIDGKNLRLSDLEAFLGDASADCVLEDEARARVARSRLTVETLMSEGRIAYGINTGFGKLKNKRIADEDLSALQRNLIRSHASGVGPPLPNDVVRIILLLRANALAHGVSGVRVELIDQLLACLAEDVLPVIPCQGSVGASGDLAPLAHMALVLIGEGEAVHRGERISGGEALTRAGLEPFELGAKEGLALINGTQVSTAIGAAALIRARRLARLADLSCGMTLEALEGSLQPFDDRVAGLRPHPGHRETADNIRRLMKDSQILAGHADCDRVQDPYSLRCAPQVHGAARDALRHTGDVLEREINSVTDNPLIFPEDSEVVSAGNFHAEPVAMVIGYGSLAACELASISERRTEHMVNPDLSNLPAFLIESSGLNSGMMIAQVTAAALVSENKGLAHPAVVDSIPTSANQEDHVSMAPIAARRFAEIVENATNVIAIELLAATHALRFSDATKSAGAGVQAARELLSDIVPPLVEDRIVTTDILSVREVMDDGSLIGAVEAAAGTLH